MKIKILLSIGFLTFLTSSVLQAQGVSATDFLPPTKGGTKKVKKKDAVSVKDNVVSAETGQDALNAAMASNQEGLTDAHNDADTERAELADIGFKWVKYGSGVGLLATGMGVYTEVPNPNATRVAQRNAYMIAYSNAKACIAQGVSGVTINDSDVFNTCVNQINNTNTTDITDQSTVEEFSNQAANALLKGYVTYSIDEVVDTEDPRTRYVFVSLASSPKTQSLVHRQGAMREVDTIVAGIEEVMLDVQSGIVPPVGGRVVNVPADDQTAFIGFGSALITSTANRALFAKNRLNARRISEARARSSLLGIIEGDQVIWQTGINAKVRTEIGEVQNYAQSDVTAADNQSVEVTTNAVKNEFDSNTQNSETVTSIRRGQLPPGIQSKTWESEDGHWVYTMMVYYPDLTNFSANFAKRMREANLVAPVDDTGGRKKPASKLIDATVKPLKGGKVSSDDDL